MHTICSDNFQIVHTGTPGIWILYVVTVHHILYRVQLYPGYCSWFIQIVPRVPGTLYPGTGTFTVFAAIVLHRGSVQWYCYNSYKRSTKLSFVTPMETMPPTSIRPTSIPIRKPVLASGKPSAASHLRFRGLLHGRGHVGLWDGKEQPQGMNTRERQGTRLPLLATLHGIYYY